MPTQRLGARGRSALGVVTRESSGCRYGHGFTGSGIDHQLRLSGARRFDCVSKDLKVLIFSPPSSDRSPSEFEARVFLKPFSLLCSRDSASLPGIRISGFSY